MIDHQPPAVNVLSCETVLCVVLCILLCAVLCVVLCVVLGARDGYTRDGMFNHFFSVMILSIISYTKFFCKVFHALIQTIGDCHKFHGSANRSPWVSPCICRRLVTKSGTTGPHHTPPHPTPPWPTLPQPDIWAAGQFKTFVVCFDCSLGHFLKHCPEHWMSYKQADNCNSFFDALRAGT